MGISPSANPMKFYGGLAAIAASMIAVAVGLHELWPVIKPGTPVFHIQMPAYIDPLQKSAGAATQAINRLYLGQLQEWLTQAQKDPAATSSPIVQQRIKQLQAEIQRTETRINGQ